MKTLRWVGLLPISILFGCATVFSGTSQKLKVQAINKSNHQVLAGATCKVSDNRGHTYQVDGNPGSTEISRGEGTLTVRCNKPGYHQAEMGVGQSFNHWTIVDILFWPTIFVDVMDGAYQKYPDHVTVLMVPNGVKRS